MDIRELVEYGQVVIAPTVHFAVVAGLSTYSSCARRIVSTQIRRDRTTTTGFDVPGTEFHLSAFYLLPFWESLGSGGTLVLRRIKKQ